MLLLRSAARRSASACTSAAAAPATVSSFSSSASAALATPVVVTAALNGVLTDPAKFPIPVTPAEMAQQAGEAYDAGASVVHIHFRDQRPGMGHLPTWEPAVAKAVCDAIRARAPDLLINMTTGTFSHGAPAAWGDELNAFAGGHRGPTEGPIACFDAAQPHIAALNSGSLNYLKLRKDGEWAWPPMLFDNEVSKVETMLRAMEDRGIVPECECVYWILKTRRRGSACVCIGSGPLFSVLRCL